MRRASPNTQTHTDTNAPPPSTPIQTHSKKVLLRLIAPYTRVKLPFLAARLNAPLPEVERLLVSLILDGKIQGSLDQVGGWVGFVGCDWV